MVWLNTDAGHLVFMQESTRPRWSGIEPPRDGREVTARFRWNRPTDPPTDYDRACDIDDVVGILDVDGQSAIVLGQEPMPTTCQSTADGGLLIARLYTSEIGLPDFVPPPTGLPWHSVGCVLFDGSPLVLFDSTEVGWADPVFPSLPVMLVGGCFEVEHAALTRPDMELWLIRLRRI